MHIVNKFFCFRFCDYYLVTINRKIYILIPILEIMGNTEEQSSQEQKIETLEELVQRLPEVKAGFF